MEVADPAWIHRVWGSLRSSPGFLSWWPSLARTLRLRLGVLLWGGLLWRLFWLPVRLGDLPASQRGRRSSSTWVAAVRGRTRARRNRRCICRQHSWTRWTSFDPARMCGWAVPSGVVVSKSWTGRFAAVPKRRSPKSRFHPRQRQPGFSFAFFRLQPPSPTQPYPFCVFCTIELI